MPTSASQPWPNSYWALPDRLLAGEYPAVIDSAATRGRIERLLALGVDTIVDLTAADEPLPRYDDLLPAEVEHHRFPIRDHGIPAVPAHMTDILETIESALRSGRRVYVHCRAGIGRTGMVVGCLLVEHGSTGEQALELLNGAWQQCARAADWPSVPETETQIAYVRSWKPSVVLGIRGTAAGAGPMPGALGGALSGVPGAAGAGQGSVGVGSGAMGVGSGAVGTRLPAAASTIRSRFTGALVGLAVGDALATATQDRDPGTFVPVADFAGGGALGLPPGAWSDDTAMALCLAESLLACGDFDARDQVERYVRWQQEGHLSATGVCVGITPSTAHALAVAQWRRQMFAGSHEPKKLDPEPLSRMAPIVMFAFSSAEEAVRLAGDAARITCQAPAVVEVCRIFAAMLHAALSDAPKEEVLAPVNGLAELEATGYRPRVRSLLNGRYRRKRPGQVRTGHTIVTVLEAALWAFDRTNDFQSGALLTANLGSASDVACAAYGQLAGAFYGAAGIPPAWRAGLLRLELIESLAEQLFSAAFERTAAPPVR
ncbi:MAG TPA: ADP-ribosylglycohydrolase family protein [Steroidobacteraceae bacterium]|nr:ADP-ribosylglycohydrolase family protein [Steroidobacteraceae bacterium]